MITVATNMAGRGTDIRLGEGVKELGGLHVIVSECHESARIDRQLFGRCSRQGDPGSARSFVCLDDELLVRYLPSTVAKTLRILADTSLHGFQQLGNKAVQIAQNNYKCRRQKTSGNSKMDNWRILYLFNHDVLE